MAEKTRILAPATLLILLAVASFAAALITITNITEWRVYAKTPPIVKVDGKLKGYNYGNYVTVDTYFAEDGTNRTVISVLGFTGDPVKYDNVLFICNKDYQGYTYNVQLVYRGLLHGTTWDYVQYIKLYFPDDTNVLYIDGGTTGTPSTGPRIIPPGTCDTVSVEVLVKPDAPADGSTRLIAIQVDVVAIKP
ncbi:MAG: hypothetical protein LM580_09285 [Thermofilum sp.]|nr:hypothetical protein [Thermofilum sp.]MCC6066115.1 hypothetical protein [Thermofilum sp.]